MLPTIRLSSINYRFRYTASALKMQSAKYKSKTCTAGRAVREIARNFRFSAIPSAAARYADDAAIQPNPPFS